MNEMRFDDRVVIITGAGRGIGRAHALLLASRGASVVVSDLGARTDGSGTDGGNPAAEVASEITAAGGTAVAVRADVSDPEEAASIVQTAIDSFGKLDAVINNAGIIRTGSFDEVPYEEYQRNLDVHFFGSLYVCRAAWPHLKASGSGRIVNTISGSMLGNAQMTHYGSSKGAVFGLTRNLALKGIDDGILVNAIAPGAGTRMAEAGADGLPQEVLDYMMASLLPEQVAPVAAYLVHPDTNVNGETFNVAGGLVNRMAVVATVGFNDPDLSIETVARRWDEVMAVTPEAVTQVVAPLTLSSMEN